MSVPTEEEVQRLHDLWFEAREVSGVLNDSWASLIRTKRLFLQSALTVGMPVTTAELMHQDLLASAVKEYQHAFTRMCELSDEYVAAKLNLEAHRQSQK